MNIRGYAHHALAAAVAVATAACATPAPVSQLAAATAQNTSMLQSRLSAFTASQSTIADSRIRNLVQLQQAGMEAEARRDRNLAFEREVGLTGPIDLYEKLRSRAVDSARQQTEASTAIAAARKSLEDKQKAVEAPIAALQDTAKNLLSASDALSFKDHVELTFKFLSEVVDSAKKAQADAAQASVKGDQAATDAVKSSAATQ